MALIKSIDTPAGVAATYWRIVEVHIDLRAKTVRYVLAGYVSKDAREDGREPLKSAAFLLGLENGASPESLTRAILYERAKTEVPFAGGDPMFADAADA